MKNGRSSYLIITIALLVVALLGLLLLATNDISLFFSLLYSPYSFLILALMLVEYLFLKGMDRSKVYKLENDRLKSKRQRDIALMKKIETQIRDIAASPSKEITDQEIRERLKTVLKNLKDI